MARATAKGRSNINTSQGNFLRQEAKAKFSKTKLSQYKRRFAKEVEEGKRSEFMRSVFRQDKWEGAGMRLMFGVFLVNEIISASLDDYCREYAKSIGVDYDKLAEQVDNVNA